MPISLTNSASDGSFEAIIALPDTNGGNVLVQGSLNPEGLYPSYTRSMSFTGSPVTAPAAPGTGLLYWIIEVNTTTGALDVQSSTTSYPTNNANCITLFSQVLAPTSLSTSGVASSSTPDYQ